MKVVSYNVKGLHDPDKAKALWSWIFSTNIDVCCIQEHKFHHLAGLTLYYKGYMLIYGGIQGSYSGTLICIKASMNPIVHMNHSAGRCLGITMQRSSSTIRVLITSIYIVNFNLTRGCLYNNAYAPPKRVIHMHNRVHR